MTDSNVTPLVPTRALYTIAEAVVLLNYSRSQVVRADPAWAALQNRLRGQEPSSSGRSHHRLRSTAEAGSKGGLAVPSSGVARATAASPLGMPTASSDTSRPLTWAPPAGKAKRPRITASATTKTESQRKSKLKLVQDRAALAAEGRHRQRGRQRWFDFGLHKRTPDRP